MCIHDVSQHRIELFLDTEYELAVNESRRWGVDQFELDTTGLLNDLDVKVVEEALDFMRVITQLPTVQNGKRAISEKLVKPALTGVSELFDLGLGQQVHAALGGNSGGYFLHQ
ncbi:hypothetical protein GCM10022278_31460 [Allohahella marinimesophila]|uniref:Uncharacterized protein n=1 Tax=Allohahella marinimesophila TaxID=1054972 RepID=A0ABP7PV80_9GAMM